MKKWIVRLVIGLVVLLVVAVAAVVLCLDRIVKTGVETAGPRITQVNVTLAGAHISLFSGSASLKGLFVGNPADYTTASAVTAGEIRVRLRPMSVLGDKIVIDSILVQSPEITFEGGLKKNNLAKIESNIKGDSSSGSSGGGASAGGSTKKIEVADLLVRGAVLHVKSPLLGGQTLTVTLPDIHLTGLGTGADGITPAELSDKVMKAVMKEVIPEIEQLALNAGANATKMGKGAEQQGQNALKKATSGLKNLFGN